MLFHGIRLGWKGGYYSGLSAGIQPSAETVRRVVPPDVSDCTLW
jgi:hypothetical protein